MYCKKCGSKINMGEKRCSDCGTDIKENEYCGGFWGLVGEEEKVGIGIPPEEKPKEELENNRTIKRYKNMKIFLVEMVLMLILMAICLLQCAQISQMSKQFDKLFQICEEQNLKKQELYDKYAELEEQLGKSLISETGECLLSEESYDLNEQDKVEDVFNKTTEIPDETVELLEYEEELLNKDSVSSNTSDGQFNKFEREELINE